MSPCTRPTPSFSARAAASSSPASMSARSWTTPPRSTRSHRLTWAVGVTETLAHWCPAVAALSAGHWRATSESTKLLLVSAVLTSASAAAAGADEPLDGLARLVDVVAVLDVLELDDSRHRESDAPVAEPPHRHQLVVPVLAAGRRARHPARPPRCRLAAVEGAARALAGGR